MDERRDSRSAGRTIALIGGLLLAIPAALAIMAGVATLVLQATVGDDGFLTSRSAPLQSDGYAIVSEPFTVDDLDDWPFDDRPRIRVTVDGDDTPTFVGIANVNDVRRSLGQVQRSVVHELEPFPGGDEDVEEVGSGDLQGMPATLFDWDESSSGSGPQVLEWEPHDGTWVIVAMNEDGSPDVAVDASFGIDLPFLEAFAWALLVFGLVLGAIAALLIGAGSRRRVAAAVGAEDEAGTAGESTLAARGTGTPVRLALHPDAAPSRWLWLVKWLLLIPHFIVLAVLWLALLVTTVFAFFAILFTARYPRGLFDFAVGVLRWTWRVGAYSFGAWATDRYPPFSLREDAEYPASLQIAYPDAPLSRGLVLVKWWLLAIPQYLILGAISGGMNASDDGHVAISLVGALSIVLAVGLLFTGRLLPGLLAFIVGLHRWSVRVSAYVLLLTDEYPPFRLDQGVEEPDSGP